MMTVTLQEIHSQPMAWREALERTLSTPIPQRPLLETPFALFTGCGSTYYLSLAAASLFQALTHRPARGVPGSELVLNTDTVLNGAPTLLFAISRSGATDETLRAVERFRAMNQGPVWAITTRGDSPLASLADHTIVLEKGQEESVVQTRSFASMYVAAVALAVLAAGDKELAHAMWELPDLGAGLIEHVHPIAQALGADEEIQQFFFLGSGMLYGLASEASLKMKEMSLSHSEPFHFLEFRHGPMSMVDRTTLLVGLVSQRNSAHEQALLEEMRALGGRTFSLGEEGTDVSFHSGLPEVLQGVLYLPLLQLMAYYRAVSRGLDPDHPRHLSPVVKIESLV
ncbi:MAG: SIS domain-containing protein [Chloroflexi bacterium]|nr:SIS domain-containing protein [Chloroflexota bacterium]